MRFVGCARLNCCESKVSRYFRLKFTDDRQILYIYKPIFVYSSTITSSFHSYFMCTLSTRVYSKFLDNIVAVLRPGNSSSAQYLYFRLLYEHVYAEIFAICFAFCTVPSTPLPPLSHCSICSRIFFIPHSRFSILMNISMTPPLLGHRLAALVMLCETSSWRLKCPLKRTTQARGRERERQRGGEREGGEESRTGLILLIKPNHNLIYSLVMAK